MTGLRRSSGTGSAIRNCWPTPWYTGPSFPGRNERLEFLGDSVLNMLTTEYLYRTFPDDPEGDLSKRKSSIVSGHACAQSSKEWDLSEYIKMGKAEAKMGGRGKESILADAYEAVLGAVYLDGGLEEVRAILNRFHFPRVQEIIAEMDPALPDATRRAIAENDLKLEKALGITKGKPMDIDGADIQKANPHWATDADYRVNCATCAPTYVLRERGFNITAKAKVTGSGSLNEQAAHHKSFAMWKNADGTSAKPTLVAKWMTDKNYKKMTAIRWSEFYEEACKETGTYITTVRWGSGGGHATIIKRLADGKLVRIEPQHYVATEGKKRSVQKLYSQLECAKSSLKKVGVLRVDDKIFDPKWAGLFETK